MLFCDLRRLQCWRMRIPMLRVRENGYYSFSTNSKSDWCTFSLDAASGIPIVIILILLVPIVFNAKSTQAYCTDKVRTFVSTVKWTTCDRSVTGHHFDRICDHSIKLVPYYRITCVMNLHLIEIFICNLIEYKIFVCDLIEVFIYEIINCIYITQNLYM